jgi:hypothetical protein
VPADWRTKDGPTVLWERRSPDSWKKRIIETAVRGEGTVLADINGDGRLDLVENSFWLECPKDPMRGEWTPHRIARRWPDLLKVAVVDLNGDGRPDIVLAPSESAGWLSWFEAPADPATGAWTEHIVDPRMSYVHSLCVADVDGDGKPDIVFAEMAQSTTKRVGFFLNGGKGRSWTLQVLATTGSHNLVVGKTGKAGALALVGCNWQGPPVEMWQR